MQCSYLGHECKDGTEHLFKKDKFPCYFDEVGSDEIILEKNKLTLAWIVLGCMIPCFILGIALIVVVKVCGHRVGLPPKGLGEGGVVLSSNTQQPAQGNIVNAPVNAAYQTNYGFS